MLIKYKIKRKTKKPETIYIYKNELCVVNMNKGICINNYISNADDYKEQKKSNKVYCYFVV